MDDEIILENARAAVAVQPRHGAAMSRYDYVAHGVRRPLLGGADGRVNLVMAPWQNRISGGGYDFEGRRVELAANSPLDPHPLHGNAWLLPWEVEERGGSDLALRLQSDGPGPYRYTAMLAVRLGDDGALALRLTVTNAGPRLPFGLGFHPNFTRTAGLSLEAPARTLTLQDHRYLPTETVAALSRPDLDFSTPRPIPGGPINNEFGGWTGRAVITWPEWGLGCTLTAPGVTRYLLYTPSGAAPFLSFEPVTHSVDAFNSYEPPASGGLVALDRGASLTLEMTLRPAPI